MLEVKMWNTSTTNKYLIDNEEIFKKMPSS